MKIIAVTLFLLLLLTQTFSKWLIVAGYQVNRDFIAANLCINKQKPKLHCKGKCQLMKKLAEEEQQDQKGMPNTIKLKIEDTLFAFNPVSINPFTLIILRQYSNFITGDTAPAPPVSIFHPPASC